MKRYLFLLTCLVLGTCGEVMEHGDPPDPDYFAVFDSQNVIFSQAKAYETAAGFVIHFVEDPNVSSSKQLWIVLSDKTIGNFTVDQQVKFDDEEKATLYFQNDGQTIMRSTTGNVELSFVIVDVVEGNASSISGDFTATLVNAAGESKELTNGAFVRVMVEQGGIFNFQDISPTDDNGSATGSQDPNDWQSETTWTGLEKGLFLQFDPLEGNSGEVTILSAFPNPSPNFFFWFFESNSIPKLEAYIVNENFELVNEYIINDNLAIGLNSLSLQFPETLPVNSGDVFRLYYQIRTTDGFSNGFGDIKFQQ